MVEMSKDTIEAAYLLDAHGLKGGVKAKALMEHPETLVGKTLQAVSRDGNRSQTLNVTKVQPGPRGATMFHFKESNRREDAEALKGLALLLPKNEIPPAPEGEVYFMDLVGRDVVGPDGAVIGKVVAVLDAPAQSLLELDNGALVPVHGEFILSIEDSPLVLTEMGLEVVKI
jgi:16S rRNA processing protein RimM